MAGNRYRGINIANYGRDELGYLSRGKEVLEGHGLGNYTFREGKDGQDPYFNYSEYMLVTPLRLLGLADKADITTIYAFYNFLGVFVLVLLIYFLALELSSDKLLSITTSLMVVGGYGLLQPHLWFSINGYGQAFSPYIPSLVTFAYLNLLIKSLREEVWRWKYLILTAFSFGLLFYIYLYAWSYILAFNLILFFLYFIRGDKERFKKILFITFFGLIIGSYNLYSIYISLHSELNKQLFYFFGASYGRTPMFNMVNLIPLLLFSAFIYARPKDSEGEIEKKRNWPLILALILTGWAVMNQQIITGKILQPAHYRDVFLVPMAIIVSLYMLSFKKAILIFLLIAVYINTAIGQYKATLTGYDLKIYRQNYRQLIDILNKNNDGGVIFTAERDNSYLFTVYTPHDLFWSNPFSAVNVPIKRIKDALYVYTYINKQKRDSLSDYVREVGNPRYKLNQEESAYRDIYLSLEGLSSGLTISDYYKKLINNDPEILKKREQMLYELDLEYSIIKKRKNGIEDLLKSYGIDYIVHDKNLYPEWDISVLGGLREVIVSNPPTGQAGNIYLYKIAK